MIVEYQLKAVVMLVNSYENEKQQCFPYWNDEEELDFMPYKVKCVSVKQNDYFVERILHISFYKVYAPR